MPKKQKSHRDTVSAPAGELNGTEELNRSGNLNGSGTAWLPESAAMHGLHSNVGRWSVMNHGSVYLRYTSQNANNEDKRGENAVDAPNWIMSMWERSIGERHRFRLRGMLSLDPATEGDDGYPLLFQTGESFEGRPLIDRQHPHDLFMELSATWLYTASQGNAFFAYFGLPGEPALGPTTFMHRPSADMNPDAPLGHHWQDATHITYGVLSLGLIAHRLKADASVFTGREPDENRWNIERPKFDSYSGRLSYRFTDRIASQVSAAFLRSPELLHPEADQTRLSASVETGFPVGGLRVLSTAFVYGGNIEIEGDDSHLTNSFLIESELALHRLIPYVRYEYVQKKGVDLGIDGAGEEVFDVHALAIGSAVRIADYLSLSLYAGAQGTVNIPDAGLEPYYGKLPLSFAVYLRLKPQMMKMHEMPGMRHEQP